MLRTIMVGLFTIIKVSLITQFAAAQSEYLGTNGPIAYEDSEYIVRWAFEQPCDQSNLFESGEVILSMENKKTKRLFFGAKGGEPNFYEKKNREFMEMHRIVSSAVRNKCGTSKYKALTSKTSSPNFDPETSPQSIAYLEQIWPDFVSGNVFDTFKIRSGKTVLVRLEGCKPTRYQWVDATRSENSGNLENHFYLYENEVIVGWIQLGAIMSDSEDGIERFTFDEYRQPPPSPLRTRTYEEMHSKSLPCHFKIDF